MVGRQQSHYRDLRRIAITAVVVVSLVLGGTAGLLFYAARAIDGVQAKREQTLALRRLDRMRQKTVEDLISASVWNEGVEALSGPPDMDWIQVNITDYYADYMGHVATIVYGTDGGIVAAALNSERVSSADVAAFDVGFAPLVRQVRLASMRQDRRSGYAFDAVATASGVVMAGGRPWIVGVATVVPENGQVARPARDPIIASAVPLSAYLTSLVEDLSVSDPSFATTSDQPARSGHVQIMGPDNVPVGWLDWTPQRPGGGIVADALPIVALLLAVLVGAGVILATRLTAVGRRLGRSESELIDARDRAQAANEAKSRFLANMSHELRTPLNGVVGMAEVLAAGPLTPLQKGHLSILKHSADDLLRLIEQLLLVTRLERDQETTTRALFDPSSVLANVVNRHRPRAEAAGLRLTLTDSLRGPRVGDADHLSRVLGYLLDNAIAFTRAGAVDVTASAEEDQVHITVTDTGVGIAPDVQRRLFQPFVQADDSATRSRDGAGLGLSICRRLVEAMDGTIRVESAPGRGSTFTLKLPMPQPVSVAPEIVRQAA